MLKVRGRARERGDIDDKWENFKPWLWNGYWRRVAVYDEEEEGSPFAKL